MNIGIIGGGISGLFSAYYLQKAGHQVTLFDKGDLSDGCSHGNAGMIVPSHIIPLAAPGMIAKGVRWMLRSTSPFYVKPRLDWDLLRWGWLFYRNATPEHVRQAIPLLRDLSLLSKQLYQQVAQELAFDWQERGLLMLYQTAGAEHEMADEARIANQAGIEAQVLTGQQVQALEPEAEVTVRGGIYYPGDAQLSPNQLIVALLAYLTQVGVHIHPNEPVTNVRLTGGRIGAVVTPKQTYEGFDEWVLAAGAWSAEVGQKLGLSLPLQGGKGYSFMLTNAPQPVRVPAIMLEARATATPMNGQLRLAGTLEIAGTDLTVNPNRVRGIVQAINTYYPNLPVAMPAVEQVWSGLRPCSPDGLPYIGRLHHLKNMTIATGHGMMGVSLGPATGQLVAQTVGHTPTSLALQGFSPERFG